jgi:glycerate kinase
MGWVFQNSAGHAVKTPIGAGQLSEIVSVSARPFMPLLPKMTILTDVETMYCDSPRLFGPQKGVSPDEVASLTQDFQRLAHLLDPSGRCMLREGSGAAGGLPFGILSAFPAAEVRSGVAWTANLLGFEAELEQADAVITGEGRFDETSLLGKVTGYVIDAAQQAKKPVLVLCGQSPFEHHFRPGVVVQPLYDSKDSVTPAQYAETPAKIKTSLLAALSAIE